MPLFSREEIATLLEKFQQLSEAQPKRVDIKDAHTIVPAVQPHSVVTQFRRDVRGSVPGTPCEAASSQITAYIVVKTFLKIRCNA
jgi:hypothetical protein